MIEGTTTTQDSSQELLDHPWGIDRQQRIHGMSTPTSVRTDVNWNSLNKVRCIAHCLGRDPGLWTTDSRSTQSSSEPEVDRGLRVPNYIPETAYTFTHDMPVSFYFRRIDYLNQASRDILGKLSGAHIVAAFNLSQETIVQDERSRRIAEMDDTLRSFSELPENWDSYGGHAISLDAIDEARSILAAAIKLNLPEPWVAPGGDAGIGIQWDTDRAELYIDIVPSDETTYALTPKTGHVGEADGVLTKENLLVVLSQLAESAT